MTRILTIAMPCYNVEAYLERGLTSLADERFEGKLEVLIINDGSTDTTEHIAARFVASHPSIFRLINKENGGHGSAINAGIAHASGTYFRIVDGDDWVATDNLAALLDQLASATCDIVIDMKREVDMQTEDSQLIALPSYVETGRCLNFSEVCNQQDTESFISIHTLNIKTSLLKKHGIRILEGIFYVDYEYIVKSTCLAETVKFVPLEIYQYLVGNANQSVAAENFVKRFRQHETMVKEMLRFAENSPFENSIQQYLERKVQLVIHTHYNILLIFDTDRKRGARRAKEFRSWLQSQYPRFAAITNRRYYQALVLHKLGFDYKRLNRFMGRTLGT
ncbi:MAG: glycosyltransferase family 2 protein [Eggerthellaceae bacterium]|nr:glycosyltransferase family 2 protein [Eggerthellaceae bacterium]